MTRYSRQQIPGRAPEQPSADLDRQVFGARGGVRVAPADNDDDGAAPDDDLFSRLPSDTGRMARDPEAHRGNMLLLGAIAVVGIFGAVVFSAYRDGLRPADSDAPPILSSAGDFKSRPVEEPVEAEDTLSDVDAQVYERMESGRNGAGALPSAGPAAIEAPTPRTESPAAVASAPTPAAEPALRPAPAPAPIAAAAAQSPAAAAAVPVPAPNPPSIAAPVPELELTGAFRPAFAAGGGYVVQLGAAASEAAAEQEWTRLAKSSGGLFAGAEKLIVRAEVNGKTVWRVRVGAFATAADADAFCSALKAKGGACFRAAR